MANLAVTPFLKWAGGKRWFVKRHRELFPSAYRKYFEPFLGGGSVFLHLQPSTGVLGDINSQLIQVYKAIQIDWRGIQKGLANFQNKHCCEFYYDMRESVFEDPIDEAVRFLYLNRTCWNGLYRVNKNGKFNVPIGTKTSVTLDTDDFEKVACLLKGFELEARPFLETLSKASKGDFVFLDPPYTVKHNHNGFIKYNQKLFSWEDQIELRQEVERLCSIGVKVLLTNAFHPSIRELYSEIGDQFAITRSSVLAAASNFRGEVEELAIKVNY